MNIECALNNQIRMPARRSQLPGPHLAQVFGPAALLDGGTALQLGHMLICVHDALTCF